MPSFKSNKSNSYSVNRSPIKTEHSPSRNRSQKKRSEFDDSPLNEPEHSKTISSWSIKKNKSTSLESFTLNEDVYRARILSNWRNRISMKDMK